MYRLPLLGPHQIINATVALAALNLVREEIPALSDEAILQGLEQVKWPGRFQILCRRPVVVVDGAHNGDSAAQLRRTLEMLFPDRRRILVFGVTEDKDAERMIETLVPAADDLIVTAAAHPRAMPVEELARRLDYPAKLSPTVSDALALALEMAGPKDIICFAGSLFVAGDALTAWQSWIDKDR